MANVRVNKQQWDAVSDSEKDRITTALIDAGAMKNDDVIIGVDDVDPLTEDTELAPMWNPIKDICKAACDVAAATALAWCTANTAGIGLAACIAAAEAARGVCRERC